MRKLNTLILALTLALLSQLALASQEPIRVGYSPVVSSAGLLIALEKGYFKEYGLEIEGTPFRGSTAPMVGLLAKGSLDVGGGNITGGLWNAIAEGAGIRLVADKGSITKDESYIALLVRADHVKSGRYKTYKDLKGFTMAFTAMGGTSQELAADRFLEKGGLKSSDVTFLKMPYSDMNAAFRTKTLDATIQLEPYITMAEQEGIAINKGPVADIYPGQISAAVFYSENFAKNRPEDATKFMAAYLRGVRDYKNAFLYQQNKQEIIDILKKHTEAADDTIWEKMIPVGMNPNGSLSKAKIKKDLNIFYKKKYVTKPVNFEQAIDNSFAEKAVKLIGKYKKNDKAPPKH